jgi:tryptophan synthase alpha chain
MNSKGRIEELFSRKKGILSLYTTAGYPSLQSTVDVCRGFIDGGADMIELGMPFSDPVADGPTIQQTNTVAIKNGITVDHVFASLREVREFSQIPVVLMGHLNTILQYGVEAFCSKCKEVGVDGLILPDLPDQEYEQIYKESFDSAGLRFIFLVTSETTEARIRRFDELGSGFLYVVSSPSVTGSSLQLDDSRQSYFQRLVAMKLTKPLVVGFGIDSRESFQEVTSYADGAIIASAFLRELKNSSNPYTTAKTFVQKIKGEDS